MDLFNSSIMRKRICVYTCEIVYPFNKWKYFEFNLKMLIMILDLHFKEQISHYSLIKHRAIYLKTLIWYYIRFNSLLLRNMMFDWLKKKTQYNQACNQIFLNIKVFSLNMILLCLFLMIVKDKNHWVHVNLLIFIPKVLLCLIQRSFEKCMRQKKSLLICNNEYER